MSCNISLLSVLFSEEVSRSWHVVSPRFRDPGISLRGQDISPQLMGLAWQSRDLFVSLHVIEKEYKNDEGYSPPFYTWEIGPPRGIDVIGRLVSSCFGDRNLAGLRVTISCAQIKSGVSMKEFISLSRDGYFGLDLPSFFNGEEVIYDRQKPEAILMEMIGRDPLVSLEFALWLLEGIRDAQEIHPEDQSFEIHEFWTNPPRRD